MHPVYKSKLEKKGYQRIKNKPFDLNPSPGKNLEFSFKHTFEYDNDTVYFAFTYPYSYKKCLKDLKLK